ncbi:MAG: DUF1624 domain-containing protein [Ignavibacteriae bacterium]|nr:DUF1624 domain-containing protein [Ignavibacteriota bacterium]
MDNSTQRIRLDSIDFLRGLVMIIMALDHVRDYFSNAPFDPLDLVHTDIYYFFTRFITHFCAPVFVFLAGTGAFLSSKRERPAELSRFLLTRGLWLVILELTVVRFGWFFNVTYGTSVGQVIWAIGWSMVALSGLMWLPQKVIAAIGVSIILFHNCLDGIHSQSLGSMGWLWNIFHEPGAVLIAPNHSMFYLYPLLPWIGVMASGYSFGALYKMEQQRRRTILLRLGLGMIAGFFAIRGINIYGDPMPWATQLNGLHTVLSFFNVAKYPPSLLYLLITLGPAMLVLRVLDGKQFSVSKPIIVFGRVPMFYYIVHIYLIHLLAVTITYIRGLNVGFYTSDSLFTQSVGERGFPLIGVYIVWVSVIIVLYPLCKWYAGVKQRDKSGWLSYL